jgi:triosephosphate isomerase (TIM)
MRRPVIAGNWKMHKIVNEAVDFVQKLKPLVAKVEHCDVVVAPPFTALHAVAEVIQGSKIGVAAQDVHWNKEGAHTGDIATRMLADAGCTYVLIGHSERRRDRGETDAEVNRKLGAALAAGLIPIACVGETLAEREGGETRDVLQRQIQRGFTGLTSHELSRIIIAYEPVWAIGTGRTATPEIAAESHRYVRELIGGEFGTSVAAQVRILYGGSVKPDNINGLMGQAEIDGALVGGASLEVESFASIVNFKRAVKP